MITIYINKQCCWSGDRSIHFLSKIDKIKIKNVWNDNRYSSDFKKKLPMISKNGGSLIPIKAFINSLKKSGELLAKEGDDEIYLIGDKVV